MNEPVLFRVIVAVILIVFVAHRGYYNRRYPPKDSETTDRLEKSKTSMVASFLSSIALISITLYVIAPDLIGWASIAFPPALRWLGLGFVLVGFALLEWSHRSLASNWSDQPRMMEAQQFVQTGPYRRIRHPMYTAFILILGSFLLISANWLVGLTWIVSVGLDVIPRIRYEEGVMQDRFGEEYELYQRTIGLLLPKL